MVHERAVGVSASDVQLSSGRRLPFDALVFATGSSYAHPIKESVDHTVFFASRGATLAQAHHELRRARAVLIIGGGIVAVELAAEIVEHFGAAVKVTIAHSGERLMSRAGGAVPPAAGDYCARQLAAMGVELCYGERIVAQEPAAARGHIFVSERGTRFECDVVFVCTGIVPNSALLRESPTFAAALAPNGFVEVDAHLRVRGFEHVFAGGDVANIREEKLAQTAEYMGGVIVNNLLARLVDSPPVATYTPGVRPVIISLGRIDAAMCWGAWAVTGFFAALAKEVVEFKVLVGYRWRFPALFASRRRKKEPVADKDI